MQDQIEKPLEWHTEQRKVSELVPYKYNPRKITPERLEKLKASLTKFNLAELPAINTDNVIIASHQRVKVLMALGRGDELIDVRVPNRTLTDKEYKEYNLISNVSVGFWDVDVLEEAFADIDLMSLGIDLEHFEIPEDAQEPPEVLEAEEDDYEIPDEIQTDIVEGDLFEIGEHRLLCGSSTEVDTWQKLMGEELCDLVVTDPPYNVDYVGKTKDALTIENDKMSNSDFYQFLLDFYSALSSFTKPGGAWYVWHADSEGANFRNAMKDSGLLLKQCLIWVKNTLVMGRQDYHWKHEPCLYGWKPGEAHNWYSDRKQTTVLNFDRPTRSGEHPTMNPIPLISYQIDNSSKKGDIVGDGFGGSGTTMVASHQLKRRCYMMEIGPNYCQVIIDRMLKLDPSLVIKRNGLPYKRELPKT
ncbi:site-specific DNA-methyltransferase (adenine-specific) [Maribacter dokdonensis]|uniref:site-specific DNA-methyltransferase (adenine-specific) n=1 Tax=Maribacter dokdonensis TaxID=320912 RepID=A0ABY0UTC8_9FLAO|nr:DNA modification methylase [Maribacter dokdonensis]SDT15587.1 site-specific DNA-methyltransferase (adenine-specific) [Maribacter dokdonensis]